MKRLLAILMLGVGLFAITEPAFGQYYRHRYYGPGCNAYNYYGRAYYPRSYYPSRYYYPTYYAYPTYYNSYPANYYYNSYPSYYVAPSYSYPMPADSYSSPSYGSQSYDYGTLRSTPR